MSLHGWLGKHLPDLRFSRWRHGHFVSACTVCAAEMIKLPGLPSRLRGPAAWR